jgi:ATP-dependent helicase STH1/SNF2
MLDEEKKLELVAGMDPAKLMSIHKRLSDLQAAGMSRENSTEFAKLSMVLDLYVRARALR